MEKTTDKPAILFLEDGRFFYGKAAGSIGTAIGKLTFHLGMTGYQKTITDPANRASILVMATTHIGNTGIQKQEIENENIGLAGLVVKNFSEFDDRTSGGISLQKYLNEQKTVAIRNVDTRAVVKHLRNNGPMMAVISSEETNVDRLKEILAQNKNQTQLETQPALCPPKGEWISENATARVAVVDFGIRKATVNQLLKRNCNVKLFSYTEKYETIRDWQPDAYLISHGAIQPQYIDDAVPLIKNIIASNKPLLALGHGYLTISRSLGINIYPDPVIHNGLNYAVRNNLSGKSEITSQNFKFIADASALLNHDEIQITHKNINDDTIVGFKLKNKPVFAVLYNPEAGPGPHDSFYHFDHLMESINQYKEVKSN